MCVSTVIVRLDIGSDIFYNEPLTARTVQKNFNNVALSLSSRLKGLSIQRCGSGMSIVDRRLLRLTTTMPMSACCSMDHPLCLTSSRMGLTRGMPTSGVCSVPGFTLPRTRRRAINTCMALEEGLGVQTTRTDHATSAPG